MGPPSQFYHSKAPVVYFPLGKNTSAHILGSGVGKSQRNNMGDPPICGYFGIFYMTLNLLLSPFWALKRDEMMIFIDSCLKCRNSFRLKFSKVIEMMVRLRLRLLIHGRNFYPSVPITFHTAFLEEGKPGPLLQGATYLVPWPWDTCLPATCSTWLLLLLIFFFFCIVVGIGEKRSEVLALVGEYFTGNPGMSHNSSPLQKVRHFETLIFLTQTFPFNKYLLSDV